MCSDCDVFDAIYVIKGVMCSRAWHGLLKVSYKGLFKVSYKGLFKVNYKGLFKVNYRLLKG
jgi:hypothetical protein